MFVNLLTHENASFFNSALIQQQKIVLTCMWILKRLFGRKITTYNCMKKECSNTEIMICICKSKLCDTIIILYIWRDGISTNDNYVFAESWRFSSLPTARDSCLFESWHWWSGRAAWAKWTSVLWVTTAKGQLLMGDVAQWLERQTSNRKTLGSIPWLGRMRYSFSVPPSQLLCRLVCAWPPLNFLVIYVSIFRPAEVENGLLAHRPEIFSWNFI